MQNHEISDVEQKTWWQRNKKRVLIAGGVAVAVVGGILLYKNWDSVTKLAMKVLRQGQKPAPQPIEIHVDLPVTDVVHEAQRPVLAIINGGEAFPVNGHIRNLPASWTPSPEQGALEQVQQLLGHQSIDTTLQYAMVNQNNVKESHRKYIG